MEQKLNIKLVENQDCSFTAVDSTAIPLKDSMVNRAFVEFVIQNDEVIFNLVNEVAAESEISTNTNFNLNSDGFFKYYKLAIPTLDYYKAGDLSYIVVTENKPRCFYYDHKIYKPNANIGSGTITIADIPSKCTKISSIMDMWDLREIDDNILYDYIEYFSLCGITRCWLSRFAERAAEVLENGCEGFNGCKSSLESEFKADFLFVTLYVLKYLIGKQEYAEAQEILNVIMSCDDSLCGSDYSLSNDMGGCGCGRN